jgi:hypothetical protein
MSCLLSARKLPTFGTGYDGPVALNSACAVTISLGQLVAWRISDQAWEVTSWRRLFAAAEALSEG